MSLTVCYIGNQILADKRLARVVVCKHLLQGLDNDFDDLNVLFFVMTAYIVGFEQSALLLHHVDGLCVVFDIQPVADVLAVAVYRKLLAVQRIVDDQRNQLFRKLVRTVVIRAVCDICREMIGIHIRFYKHIRSCLAGRVRAVGRIGGCLIEIAAVFAQRAVYFIRRNMQEFLARLKCAVRKLPRVLCAV